MDANALLWAVLGGMAMLVAKDYLGRFNQGQEKQTDSGALIAALTAQITSLGSRVDHFESDRRDHTEQSRVQAALVERVGNMEQGLQGFREDFNTLAREVRDVTRIVYLGTQDARGRMPAAQGG